MTTFRQDATVFTIGLIAMAGVFAQISWLPVGDSLGMFVNLLLSKEFLPLTLGLVAIFGLALYWNPDD
jgi:hypothetical protein